MNDKTLRFATRAIHAGQKPDPATRALATPIHQTSSFAYEDSARLLDGLDSRMKRPGQYFYSRGTNPTVEALEIKMASLESAEACMAASSGMGAISAVLFGLLNAGDHVIASNDLFVCTRNLFEKALPSKGIEATRVDAINVVNIQAAIQPNTKMLYIELLSNPRLELADLPAVVSLAQKNHLLLVVDNTFLSPYLIRPLEYGADIVVHSATKYIGGHGDTLGGTVSGRKELIDKVRFWNNDMGACMSPFNAWLLLRGLRTLPLRMRAISQNAQSLAEFFNKKPEVSKVIYPGLENHPQHELACRLLPNGMSGMISLYLKGGTAEMESFVDNVKLMAIATSLGDVQTLIYPRHHDGNLIRFSVGIEDIHDLIEDVEQAFGKIKAETVSN